MRIVAASALLWVLAVADLQLTIWAHHYTPFAEGNPVAARFLVRGMFTELAVFKLSATLVGTGAFWHGRQTLQGEAAAWVMLGVYVALIVRWAQYVAVSC